jgi:hypothetical protein
MNKTIGILLLAFLPATSVLAQDDAAKYAGTITKEDLQKHLTIVAGAEMEGRETGTEGQRKAATYIADYFKQLGLLPVPGTTNYQQFFGIGYDSVINSQLIIDGKFLDFGKDYVTETALNNNGNFQATEIVFVGYGINAKNYNDYAGKKVKGKVVVFVTGEPKINGISVITGKQGISDWTYPGGNTVKARLAKENGAVGAIVINVGFDTINSRQAALAKKSNFRVIKNTSNAINCITIGTKQARLLLGNQANDIITKAQANMLLNKQKFYKKIALQYNYAEQKISTDASNVCAYLEGTDKKEEFIVLSAHYDHLGKKGDKIYYGADDDGSGTCAVLEMAEAFSKAKAEGIGPRRSVLFLTFSGEEKGLWGSDYYSDSPLFPLEKTSVNLNTDMVGRIDPKRTAGDSTNYVYIIGYNRLSSELKPISESINKQYINLELDYKYNDPKDPERIYYRSDHYSFAKKGVPILFYFNGLHADYHRETDVVEKINWDIYTKRTHLIFHTAWEIANKDALLKRDMPLE